jgi:superfamily II DNA/RNA helicase
MQRRLDLALWARAAARSCSARRRVGAQAFASSASATADADAAASATASAAPPPAAPTWTSLGVPSHLLGKLQLVLRSAGGAAAAPTPVQAAALPHLLRDLAQPPGDTLLHAETGSGKTLAYLLPVFARLDAAHAPAARLRAVVCTPTRELSLQVAEVAKALAAVGSKKDASRAVRVLRVVGEVSAQLLHDLKACPPHVLVGTPATLARLVGVHVNTGELQLLVLDEADELLRNHSVAAVRELVAAVRKHGNRPGTLAVSATSSFGLQQFVGEHMRKGATVVDLTRGAMVTPATLSHFVVRLGRANAMFNAFTRLLAALRPACALSFHNSARSMEALEAHLRARGVPVGMLGNAYANAQRARALEGVREGRLRVLLSTEMAARGLDLPRVSHVINFDPPTSVREYVHRAGRAGRLSSLAPGRAGAVISFAGGDAEQDALVDICRELGVGLSQMSFEAGEAVVAGVGGGAAGVTQATQVTQELIAPVLGDEERARHERTLREERRVRGGRKGGVAGAGARAKDAELAARREIETMA